MTSQLLLRYDAFDRSAFDAAAEARDQAGLSLLQLWREGGAGYWALLSVNDADRARAWLDTESGLGRGPSASHLLETA